MAFEGPGTFIGLRELMLKKPWDFTYRIYTKKANLFELE